MSHSEPSQTSTMERSGKWLTANIVFAISALHVFNFMKICINVLSTGLILTREVFTPCKKYGAEGSRGREFLISLLVDVLK